MDLNGRALWQVGAGDTERSYGDLCLKYDVMIVGPGRPGPFSEDAYASFGDIRNSIRRFYRDAKKGDLVLLRLGTNRVLAVGEIADDEPTWTDAFADVDGWDLQHIRHVRWFPDSATDFAVRTLGGQVRTFAAVGVQAVREWVASLPRPGDDVHRQLAPLPASAPPLSRDELARQLFIEGLPRATVARLLDTITSLDGVASWYSNPDKRPEGRPSENETVAYLVLPLLFSLGWSEQTAAVEWRSIDVALFRQMPANDANLTGVVEAKLLGRSVFQPFGQARNYALRPERENVGKLIVTDGIRYTVHHRRGSDFTLVAYLNILDLRLDYPVFGCAGAVNALLEMAK